MSNRVRALVSKKKKRFKEDGFDLDLSYITWNIVAMGYPSEGLEGKYRNHMKDVQRFWKKYHKGHYKIYNLCSERQYDPTAFEQVARYPFDDHNPCSLKTAIRFCEDCAAFLKAHPKNVVGIHCKAGKGRTGTLIACLLLFMGTKPTAKESLAFFGKQRTKNNKGVTIPSQRRYVMYFEYLLNKFYHTGDLFNYRGVPLTMTKIKLKGVCNFDVGGGCDPYFKIKTMTGDTVYNSKKQGPKIVPWRKEPTFTMHCDVPLQGNNKIIFYDWDRFGGDDKMFGFWIHTSCIFHRQLLLTKNELDGCHKDKKNEHFPPDFEIEVTFQGVPQNERKMDRELSRNQRTYFRAQPEENDDDDDDDEDDLEEALEYRWACEEFDLPPPPPVVDSDDEVPPPPPPGETGGRGRGDTVVPPPPPAGEADHSDVRGRGESVVPPPPPDN